ncbi:MAG: ATP-binding protein [Actinomycetota bacterium]
MRLLPIHGRKRIGNRSEITVALTRFLVVGFASLVLVAIPTVLLFENIAKDRALKAATANWRSLSIHLVAPQTTAGVIARDQAALAQIDAVVRPGIRDGSIVRIKIWDMTGRVLYSNEPRLIGRVYPLPEAASLLRSSNPSIAEVSNLQSPENEFEKGQPQQKLVEVYTLARASTGQQLIFEAYFPTLSFNQEEHELLAQIAPVGLAALIILNLAQLPSAMDLARRVQRSRKSRERLLIHAAAAADHERRKLAQELHDDVIQDLAGVGYALSSLDKELNEAMRPMVAKIGSTVCRDIALLRDMVTQLYPQSLAPQSLSTSLNDLGISLRQAGVNVTVDVDEQLTLDLTSATLVYRVARESLHNAEKHAQPRNVDVRLTSDRLRTVLTVVDDGRGFDPSAAPAPGHIGMRLTRDTVAEAGGTFVVDSRMGSGTRVELSLPVA